jgi:surface antigen
MLKQKIKNSNIMFNRVVAIITIGVMLAGVTLSAGLVKADQYDQQIQALQDQNSANQSLSNSLAAQASSYQDAVNKLQAQIDQLQQNIVATQQKEDDVKAKMVQAQADLAHAKVTLGQGIKTMYLEGNMSTLEVLASSTDLSQYVTKQQYRTAVEQKVTNTVSQITALETQLQSQQKELDGLVKDLQTQQAQANSAANQQSQLLSYTEGQKAAYDTQIKNNNSQISTLRAAQAAANRKLSGGAAVTAGDPGHGGYPSRWDSPVPQDSLIDSWGMFNRECVSYTAWKVYQTFGYMPYWGGVGNANQWPSDAANPALNGGSIVPTGSTPRVHSVAISMGGAFGHAMWVESVDGNMIHVSQMNYDLAGHYSEMTINGSGLIYIYFGS